MKKLLVFMTVLLLGMSSTSVLAAESVELILDWVPNTNHTGLFVAQDLGYFEEAGVDITIRRPPEGSTTELVGVGQAEFGISFQDTLAPRLVGGLPVTAVAAIIEHNTSGIIATKDSGINKPADLTGKSYGTWNDPVELAIVEYLVNKDNGKFADVKLVPNTDDNSIVAMVNKAFDSAWIYYAWDGIMADFVDLETNYFNLRDYDDAFDFYSPIIIANNDYLKANDEEAHKIIGAIRRGYQYAMENPEEAADILINNAPELEDQREMVIASQQWLSTQYASDPEQWGKFDSERWNAFYTWLFEHKLIEKDLTEQAFFTNDYLGE